MSSAPRSLLASDPNLGGLLSQRQRGEEALVLLDRAAALNSRSPDLWFNRGRALAGLRRGDEACAAYQRAVDIDPGYFKAFAAWASLEAGRNNLERASELAQKAIAIAPDHPDNLASHTVIAKYYRRKKELDRALAELEKIDLTGNLGPAATRQYHFERGTLLDALKRYDEAFESYRLGNEAALVLGGDKYRYNKAAHEELARRLMQFFTPARVQAMSQLSPPVRGGQPKPIFIVGFPRSGTTLTEQILGSHPAITPGDELPYLGELARPRGEPPAERGRRGDRVRSGADRPCRDGLRRQHINCTFTGPQDGIPDPGFYYVQAGKVRYNGISFHFGFKYTF